MPPFPPSSPNFWAWCPEVICAQLSWLCSLKTHSAPPASSLEGRGGEQKRPWLCVSAAQREKKNIPVLSTVSSINPKHSPCYRLGRKLTWRQTKPPGGDCQTHFPLLQETVTLPWFWQSVLETINWSGLTETDRSYIDSIWRPFIWYGKLTFGKSIFHISVNSLEDRLLSIDSPHIYFHAFYIFIHLKCVFQREREIERAVFIYLLIKLI